MTHHDDSDHHAKRRPTPQQNAATAAHIAALCAEVGITVESLYVICPAVAERRRLAAG